VNMKFLWPNTESDPLSRIELTPTKIHEDHVSPEVTRQA
jgi:hypothetical protein